MKIYALIERATQERTVWVRAESKREAKEMARRHDTYDESEPETFNYRIVGPTRDVSEEWANHL